MSVRIAKQPIPLPSGVKVQLNADMLTVQGPKGELNHKVPSQVKLIVEENEIRVDLDNTTSKALAGTTQRVVSNHVTGVSQGFEKKLILKGVGYRAQAKQQGKQSLLNLTLGISHPLDYLAPEGISLETPSQTEILVKGCSKHMVGQVAADIRNIKGGIRKPEPYKGKGIRYADEHVALKDAKK